MKLSIKYKPLCEDRPWLIKREGGEYEQHAHLKTKKDAIKVRQLVDANKYPYCHDYKIAIQRLLTEEEFKKVRQKTKIFNVNKGFKR